MLAIADQPADRAVLRAPRDLTIIAGAVAIATAAGWTALVAWVPATLTFLCGPAGLYPLVAPWGPARLAGLLAMWSAMTALMMLPCLIAPLLDERPAFSRPKPFLAFGAGYLGLLGLVGAGGGIMQWALESMGAMNDGSVIENPLLRIAMLAGAVLFFASGLVRARKCSTLATIPPFAAGLGHGQSRLAICAAMICLQLAGGAMDLAWAAILAVWMFADSLLPKERAATASALLFAILAGLLLFTL